MNSSFGITFEIHSLCRDLLKNIWSYILAFLIGMMGCYVYSGMTYNPTYTSSCLLCVNRSTGGATTYSNIKYSEQLTSVFSEIFMQNAVATKAQEEVGISNFNGSVEASAVEGTNFLTVSVTSSSPDTSYKMLHAVLDVCPEISEKLLISSVITVLQQPNMPKSPNNSISVKNNIKIGLVCSAFSLAIVAALSLFRTTIKDEASFYKLVDSNLLGSICHEGKKRNIERKLKNKKSSLLIYNNQKVSLTFVESYQKIATRLEYMKRREGSSVFMVTSVAENEGKSTAASNIAISLASRGNKVLLFDFDLKRPALYKIFDISNDKQNNAELSEMMAGTIDLSNYMFCRFRKSSLYMALNTKASNSYHSWMEKDNVRKVLDHFRQLVDFIVIDTAPLSVDSSITNILPIADVSFLLVRTDVVYASAINDAILTIKDVGGKFGGCILNDVYPEFSMLGQTGYDETGYYGKRYGYGYGSRYGNYGHYGSYGAYGAYGKYGRYGSYGKYGRYGKYGGYNKGYGKYGRGYYGYGYSEALGLFDDKEASDKTDKKS